MALTDIELCARALIKLGAAPISSFTSGSAESDIASALYTVTRDALLTAYPWSFASKQAGLTQLSTRPLTEYNYAYALPSDFLRAVSAGGTSRARGTKYRLQNGQLHCNENTVILSYIYRAAETDFPPYFDSVLIARLAAEFCIPLTENTARADALFKIADEAFKNARGIDAQQDSPSRFEHFSLIDARG